VGADETLAQLNTLLALAPERLAAIAATLPPHALSQARARAPAQPACAHPAGACTDNCRVRVGC